MKKSFGIQNRIHDSIFLWESGRHESAFLLALIAVAASAREKHPRMNDGDAFKEIFKSFSRGSLNVEYRGKCQPIEEIFYVWLRCELVHNAELPVDIKFTDADKSVTMSVRAGGAPEHILKIGHGWFHHIINNLRR